MVNAIEDDGPILGDGPADIVVLAMQQVHAGYKKRWGRMASEEEMRLLLEFCGWFRAGAAPPNGGDDDPEVDPDVCAGCSAPTPPQDKYCVACDDNARCWDCGRDMGAGFAGRCDVCEDINREMADDAAGNPGLDEVNAAEAWDGR